MYKKALLSVLLPATVLILSSSCQKTNTQLSKSLPLTGHPKTDSYDGWQLGTQAYTFRKFTFYEAVDKAASLGLGWIEMYPGQPVSKQNPDIKTGPDLPQETRQQIKQKLKDSGITLACLGVIGLPNNEAECRKVFEFAKDMNIKAISSEPEPEALDLIEKRSI